MLRRRFLLIASVLLPLTLAPTIGAAQLSVTVFAAASVKDALDEASRNYEKEKSVKIVASYGATSALAKQIENGAPADIFISADVDWMNYVDTRKLIKSESRCNLLTNRLVLIVPKSSNAVIAIGPGFPLATLLGNDRLAIADPVAVPAGKYGKAALENLGVWKEIEAKIAPTENVRAALALVSRAEAPFGIVYRTDALVDKGVRIAGEFPASTHAPIVYPVALTSVAKSPAQEFLAYLSSPAARAVFEKYGF
jgi:molybdate transport system substrate-binding protein